MMDNSLKAIQQNSKTKNTVPGFDNCWSDSVWRESKSVPGNLCGSIKWDFHLNDGSKFTDIKHQQLLHTLKDFILSLITDPPAGRGAKRTSTLVGKFQSSRLLVSWMIANGIYKYSELDKTVIQDYVLYLRERKGIKGQGLSESTFVSHVNILRDLYLQRDKDPKSSPNGFNRGDIQGSKELPGIQQRTLAIYTGRRCNSFNYLAQFDFYVKFRLPILDVRDEYEKEYSAAINNGRRKISGAKIRAAGVIKKTTKWQCNDESIEWVNALMIQ